MRLFTERTLRERPQLIGRVHRVQTFLSKPHPLTDVYTGASGVFTARGILT